jgi:hypothetical protein
MMKLNVILNSALVAGALLVPAAAAHAEKPTVILMHRDIKNVQDEQRWNDVARDLEFDGFHVVSMALQQNSTPTDGAYSTVNYVNAELKGKDLLLVGTASVSDAMSLVAEQAPNHVKALMYLVAATPVRTLGPRTVSEPAALVGRVPSIQVTITNIKHMTEQNESGVPAFRVREEGKSTLANVDDLEAAIELVSRMHLAPQTATASVATSPSVQVASLQ